MWRLYEWNNTDFNTVFLVLRYKKNDRMACIKIELTER